MKVNSVQEVDKIVNYVLQNFTFREIGTDGELDDIADFIVTIFSLIGLNVRDVKVIDIPSDQVFQLEINITGENKVLTIDMQSETTKMAEAIWDIIKKYI